MLKIGGWGEPALHSDFGEMMSHCLDVGVRTVVYTNGTIFERLTNSEILELKQATIVFSVDGHNGDEYNTIRVGGNYDRLRESIARLYELKKKGNSRFPILVVQHVVFPNDTSREIAAFRRSWITKSDMVDFCIYNPFVPAGTLVENAFRRRCKRVKRELSILYDGVVPVCGPQSKYSECGEVGNVVEGSIAEIWNGHGLAEVRAAHQTRDLDSMPLCKSCIYFR
jgi:MoaA/NifB/PqqE/SkfB family radical SAM enzyme